MKFIVQTPRPQHFRCRANKRVIYTEAYFPGGTTRGKAQALRWGARQNTLWEKDHLKGNCKKGQGMGAGLEAQT